MESVQGSWQYENFSSANETTLPASPSSPAMYNQLSPYNEQGLWDDFCLTKELDMEGQDPFIGSGGEQQLLSSTGESTINAYFNPVKVLPKIEVEESHLPAMYVDPNEVQPLPAGDVSTIDLSDLEDIFGEIDFSNVVATEQTAAQEYVDITAEQLNEASVNLGSPLAAQVPCKLEVAELGSDFTIDEADIVPQAELEAALGDHEAINFDDWIIMDQGEDVNDNSSVMDSVYDSNDNSYMDSSSQMSSAMGSDEEDDMQEETIDALMRYDLPAAQAAIVNSNFAMPAVATYIVQQVKSERRGRKPSSTSSAKSWHNVKDKGLRKKQQNKIAATKYRQKKKEEAKVSMLEESVLHAEFTKLSKNQQSLADKIKQVKELLKEKYNWNSL